MVHLKGTVSRLRSCAFAALCVALVSVPSVSNAQTEVADALAATGIDVQSIITQFGVVFAGLFLGAVLLGLGLLITRVALRFAARMSVSGAEGRA